MFNKLLCICLSVYLFVFDRKVEVKSLMFTAWIVVAVRIQPLTDAQTHAVAMRTRPGASTAVTRTSATLHPR